MRQKTYIKDDRYKQTREEMIDQALLEHARKHYKLLMFPMNSNMNKDLDTTPFHWTLLVLDISNHKWTFYNSNLHRGARKDQYIPDAELVMRYIKEKLQLIGDTPSFDLAVTLYEFEACKKYPQQGATIDCAMFVMHLIETLARNEPVRVSITPTGMMQYKFEFMTRFLDSFEKNNPQKV